ncbi:MAG: carboxypeptidase regulatory-like domain-containing protein, partial [Myxococcales bacterium]|nr:carboxypeptidase regulatory-like domain-containing protein [Myxococcales bacterium]
MRAHVVLASAAVLAALAGCEDVPATNPFDPATPVSQQAQARLEGTVTLPDGFGASNLAEGRVDLVDGAGEIALTGGVAEGTFLFEAVNAGAYLVRVVVPGLVVAERPVQVFRGETTRLPPIALEAPGTEDPDALFVVGVAQLEGAPQGGHQGIYVEVQETPYNALTARDGTFRVQAPPGERTVAVSFPGYGLQTVSVVVQPDTPELTLPEPIVLNGQPGRVQGRVRLQPGFEDPAQLMAADVALFAGEGDGEALQRTNPSADGAFVFADVPPGEYEVRVTAMGFFDEVRRADVAPGGTDDLALITLFSNVDQAPGSITGVARLQGRADDAHGGVLVKAVNQPYLTETEPDGSFTLRVPEGAYTLRLSRPGYGPAVTERLIVGPGASVPLADPVVLVALPGRVQGGVVLPFGEADSLPQVEVTLADDDPETVDATTNPRREDGTFLFPDVPPGDYTLRITRDRFVPYERPVTVTPEASVDVGSVELQPVPQTATISGVAQRQGRQGHGGIRVDLVGAPNTTTTNAEGRFELVVPVSAEGYDLVFTADGYNSARLEGLAGLGPDAMFELDEVVVLTAQPGRVHGFVELQPTADGGFDPSWVEDVVVTLIEAELEVPDGAPAPERTVSPDGEGRFVFENVAPGSYGVTFARQGFRERFSAATVGVGQSVFIGRVSLVPELGSPDAQPSYIQGVARLECDGECDHGGIRVESSAGGFAALTTRTGAYRLQVVESDYTLRFSREGYRTVVPAEVIRVAEGETAPGPGNVILAIDPGSVSGVVLGLPPQGAAAPLGGAQVAVYEITPDGEALRGEVTTVDDGAFVIGGLRGGAYTLRITAPGRAPHSEQVAVAPGLNTGLGNRTVDLLRGGLTGAFPRADGAQTGGVTVLVRGAPGEAALQNFTWVAVTDPANDRYRLDGLPVGRYEVTAAAPGYRTEVLAEPIAVLAEALAQASGTLAPRRNGLDAPPVTRNPLIVTLTADEDNTFGRVWHGGQQAPAFRPLPADGAVQLMLPRDGTHRIFAEVANAAFTDDDPSNDVLAAVSPTLSATVLLDETPPDLSAVTDRPAVGAEPGWVALPDPALVEVYAADPAPASGLAFVRVSAPGMAPIQLPYSARVQVPLPEAGDWPLMITVVDGAGNTRTAPQPLVVHADAAPPEDVALALAGPARVPGLSGRVRVSATDLDGAPLWFR